ncbi:MAG: hypothetical protein IKZ98_08830 [Clostridia bacterium]|nr:hypothetical protein [Clostridia bacterium]
MKRMIAILLLAALMVLSVVPVCFAALSCTHKSCTYQELWQKKDAPVYVNCCQYSNTSHPHIHQFWKVTGRDTCDNCGKSWTVAEYTVDIRTYCPFGPR